MTVEDITNNENKNASEELIDMIDSFVMTYKVTTEERDKQVKAIIDKGRAEELSDKQIRGLIEVSLRKHGISDRTIRRALPDELKNINMVREPKPKIEIDDRVEQSVPEPIPIIDVPVPVPVPVPTRVNTWDGKDDSDMTIEELRERNRQNLVKQGKIPDSVYREPDRVEPRPVWNKDKMDTVQEQSFHTMTVEPNVPVVDRQDDYTVTTQLQIQSGSSKFSTDIIVHCSPKDKTVTVEPIDKTSIVKVRLSSHGTRDSSMTVETVKATYDRDTKAIYVWLGNKGMDKCDREIVRTISSLDNEIHYDLDKNGEIVGIEVILS